jgi:exopolysaccharide biosynthesis WecB/TagA/CpsF family protein
VLKKIKTPLPSGQHLARCLDFSIALAGIALLAPVLLVRAIVGRVSRDRFFDATPAFGRECELIELLEFAGPQAGRRLARIFNLLRGDISLGGPRACRIGEYYVQRRVAPRRFDVRPGLVHVSEPRELMGIVGEAEPEADLRWITEYSATKPFALAVRWVVARVIAGPADRPAAPFLEVLGVRLDNTHVQEAVDWLVRRTLDRRRTFVAFANPDCLNAAQGNLPYRRALQRANRVFADGSGVRIAARLLGQRMKGNVNGTDLFPELCRAAATHGLRPFLLGARPGLAETAAHEMQQRFPGLQFAGTAHGYFAPHEAAAVIERINYSGADLLLVAMGAPQQELWLAQHGARIDVPVQFGVGGLFDYYSGRIPRAPAWLREAGCEWVWRLACEPTRLWRRYLLGNPLFIARVLRDRLTGRRPMAAAAIHLDSPIGRNVASARSAWRRRAPSVRLRMADAGKRALDVAASGTALLLLAPALALTALAIRLESPGSIVFRQQRIGRHGQPFTMLKFRSMFVDAEARKAALLARNEMAGGVIFKMKDDPRVTRVGRFIRRTSIDELPQLINVLRGDMSLVGPRPPLPSEVAQYSLHDRGRLGAAPGITCIWQVSGRSEIPFPQQVEMDLDYIHRQSVVEDVRLLLKTVPALLFGRGAY